MNITTAQEKIVTETDLIAEAQVILEKRRCAQDLANLNNRIYDEHKSFYQTYPLIVRYIVEFNMFNVRAFKRFLRYVKMNVWDNEQKFILCQAKYIKFLYAELNSHCSQDKLNEIEHEAGETLWKEHLEFKKRAELAQKNEKEREKIVQQDRKRQLVEYVKNNRQRISDLIEQNYEDGQS